MYPESTVSTSEYFRASNYLISIAVNATVTPFIQFYIFGVTALLLMCTS
jgi:hypothetical protein